MSVRNTKQLDPSKFKLTNPRWTRHLNSIVSSVRDELGQLYKCLLYEPGSFFSPHRDSEKAEGVFGTLVVILPTKYTGGELVVHLKKETKVIDQSLLSEFNTQSAVFYADCKHELQKLISGCRLLVCCIQHL